MNDENGKKIKQKCYDFVLVAYRPYDNGFYIEKYTDITADMFNSITNQSTFQDPAAEYITNTSVVPYEYDCTGGSWIQSWIGVLGKDDDGKDFGKEEVPLKQITVTITQPTPGEYCFNIAGNVFFYETSAEDKETNPEWYDKDGYRMGAAGYYANAPLGTHVKAMFDSKNSITRGL